MKERIVVIVNKTWEAAPILGVFSAPYAQAKDPSQRVSSRPFYWLGQKRYPVPEMWPDAADPARFPLRYVLRFDDVRVECWCLADFKDTSDSIAKCTYIPKIVAVEAEAPRLVIAIGTAASIVPGLQGSVVGGCRTFMHDANPDIPKQSGRPPEWPAKLIDTMMESTFAPELGKLLASQASTWMADVQSRMVPARNGEGHLAVMIKPEFVAVGDLNVGSDPSVYAAKDAEALQACHTAESGAEIGSIETTNALIRAMVEPAPYLFLSGIANNVGQFGRDVGPNPYSQNFAPSHNAGVVLAALLPVIIPRYS